MICVECRHGADMITSLRESPAGEQVGDVVATARMLHGRCAGRGQCCCQHRVHPEARAHVAPAGQAG